VCKFRGYGYVLARATAKVGGARVGVRIGSGTTSAPVIGQKVVGGTIIIGGMVCGDCNG